MPSGMVAERNASDGKNFEDVVYAVAKKHEVVIN